MTVATNNLVGATLGSSPDFPNGMPTVEGVPIVESGSNSDGTWTKWANGDQLCRLDTPGITTSDVGSYTWSFPAAYLSKPFCTAETEVTSNSRGYKFQNTPYGTATLNQGFFLHSLNVGSTPSAQIEHTTERTHFFAFGKWK